jgi:hypothetical protein
MDLSQPQFAVSRAALPSDLPAVGTDMIPSLSRREFLSGMAATGAAISVLGGAALAQSEAKPRFKIIGFTKPFQTASPSETADMVAEIGAEKVSGTVLSPSAA